MVTGLVEVVLPLAPEIVVSGAGQGSFVDLDASELGLVGLVKQIVHLLLVDGHPDPPSCDGPFRCGEGIPRCRCAHTGVDSAREWRRRCFDRRGLVGRVTLAASTSSSTARVRRGITLIPWSLRVGEPLLRRLPVLSGLVLADVEEPVRAPRGSCPLPVPDLGVGFLVVAV